MTQYNKLISDIVFITASGPQSGKTTAMMYLSRMTGAAGISTSDIVTEEFIKQKQKSNLTVSQIKKERLKDPNKYRKELIDIGIEMNRAGIYPSSIAVERGYAIIEGARRSDEIVDAILTAHKKRNTVKHVHIVSNRTDIKDSTDPQSLYRWANIIIENNGTLDSFYKSLDKLLMD